MEAASPRVGRSWSLLVVWCATAICAILVWQWRLKGEDGNAWERVIRGDARGYYSYLPALLIHGDPQHDGGGAAYMNRAQQGTVRKYPVGVALMELPLFITADVVVSAGGGARTGYERPYQVAVALGGILSLLIGLLVLRRVLLGIGFNDRTTALT